MDLSRWHPLQCNSHSRENSCELGRHTKMCLLHQMFSFLLFFIFYSLFTFVVSFVEIMFFHVSRRKSAWIYLVSCKFFCSSSNSGNISFLSIYQKNPLDQLNKKTKDEVHIVYQSFIIKLINSSRLILSKPSSAPK